MGIRCADHVTPLYPQKLALTSPTGGGRSVGIVRSRTKATESVIILGRHYTGSLVAVKSRTKNCNNTGSERYFCFSGIKLPKFVDDSNIACV